MKIRYLPEADGELEDAVAYYHARNPQAAKRFDAAVRHEEWHLQNHPYSAAATLAPWRAWPIPHFPYSLIYQVARQELIVVALAHHSRRPGYWKDRLREAH